MSENGDTLLLGGATVVTPDATLEPGWVQVRGEVLAGVGGGTPPRSPDVDLTGHVIVPGFVDAHVHGGGGAAYTSGVPDEAARAAALHLRHGTTSTAASLLTAGIEVLERQVSALADLVEDGLLAGLHLEGPWLSRKYCGAHDPALLRAPDITAVRRLLRAGRGAIRMVTIAPELHGALDAIREIVGAGAVVAVGHTDATYEQTRRALDAGATVATHLFNAMRPVHHREPGPVLALLEDPRVHIELIADGVHLHPASLRHAASAAGPGRALLVTDAMAAAGAADGDYRLGELDVRVTDGVARLRDGGAIAGSTLTMDIAFERAVAASGLSMAAAAAAASTTPADALGLADVGSLREGRRADLVVLNRSLHTVRVMRAGRWVEDDDGGENMGRRHGLSRPTGA